MVCGHADLYGALTGSLLSRVTVVLVRRGNRSCRASRPAAPAGAGRPGGTRIGPARVRPGAEAGTEQRRFINYPRGRVLAVADDGATADRAVAALGAAGWDPGLVERVTGGEAANAFDATGAGHGLLAESAASSSSR